jgi:hypothetical protein
MVRAIWNLRDARSDIDYQILKLRPRPPSVNEQTDKTLPLFVLID